MKLLNEISRTIHAIRCAADVDVERLCFEVSPEEWVELLRYCAELQGFHGASSPAVDTSCKSMTVMGITVRERPQ